MQTDVTKTTGIRVRTKRPKQLHVFCRADINSDYPVQRTVYSNIQ